ncbi:MAG TPA: MBL fold metallo-hydrolase [Bacillota bacterium]
MDYRRFVLGELETNCYLVWSGRAAGVIDPGGPVDQLIQTIDQQGLELKWVLNTHGHGDHIAGNALLKEHYQVPVLIHAADRLMLQSAAANLSAFMGTAVVSPPATKNLADGEILPLGEAGLEVIATPGHTPGGIALYTPGLLFSGDTLFRESIGRTDFPGGDQRTILVSIRDRLLKLPQETVVLPGHGEATTIGHELKHNPYLVGIDAL